MTFLKAKRLKSIYFELKYNNSKKIYKDFFVKKMACVCFFGLPVKITSRILVPAQDLDMNDHRDSKNL